MSWSAVIFFKSPQLSQIFLVDYKTRILDIDFQDVIANLVEQTLTIYEMENLNWHLEMLSLKLILV